jgi:diamine N-acetyltransferase
MNERALSPSVTKNSIYLHIKISPRWALQAPNLEEMSELYLEELSAANAVAANSLELRPGQEAFATPTTYTQEEPGIDPTKAWSRVIKKDNDVVGFVRAYVDPQHPQDELRCCIWRITVAGAHQGAGVGRFAVNAVIEEAKRQECEKLTVMWTPGDEGPGEFFHRLGFQDIGDTAYGDRIGALPLNA